MMKYLLLICLVACGGVSGSDAGTDGASQDGTMGTDASNDGSGNDGSGNDASNDSSANDGATGGDAGIGDKCDPNDSQCMAGLLCCPGGTALLDGGVTYTCKTPLNGKCPLVP